MVSLIEKETSGSCGTALADVADRSLWLVGDGAERYGDVFEEQFDGAARIVESHEADLPLNVAILARERFETGQTDDPISLRPHYVRRPDARPPAI